MSKHIDPVARLWNASLLILGSVLALSLAVQVLAAIWGWLVLIGVIVAAVFAASWEFRRRRNDW